MKLSVLLVVVVSTALLISRGKSEWPWEPEVFRENFKVTSLINADCIKAKIALGDCVREKLISPWFSKPLVKDCCSRIANHKKSCPGFIVRIDEHLIPHYIKNACHSPAPGPASSN